MNENATGLKDILEIVTGHRNSSQGGTWTKGEGIDLPCTYMVYGHTNWMTRDYAQEKNKGRRILSLLIYSCFLECER